MNDNLNQKMTGAGLDAMAAMLPHLDEILKDEEYSKIKARVREGERMTAGEVIMQAFPLIAVKHRAALYGVISAVTGQTAEEIDAQPLTKTMDTFEGALGNDILGFFTYCARMVARL